MELKRTWHTPTQPDIWMADGMHYHELIVVQDSYRVRLTIVASLEHIAEAHLWAWGNGWQLIWKLPPTPVSVPSWAPADVSGFKVVRRRLLERVSEILGVPLDDE